MEKAAKYLLGTVLIIFVIFIILVAVCAFIDFFNIKSIQIVNNERFDDTHYTDEVSDLIGKNGFGTLIGDIDSIKSFMMVFALRDNKIEQYFKLNDPYVDSVKVSFLPPDKLMVEIAERQECFSISFLDKTIFLSRDLVVLGETSGSNVPEIKGVKIISCEEGRKMALDSGITTALDEIFENSVYQGKDIFEKIRQIDFSDGLMLVMDNNVSITFGSCDDIAYKMKCLNEIYYEYLSGYSNGNLDLSDKNRKVYCPG
jgi:hypothetical protein